MKKNFEKIVSIALGTMSLIFVVALLIFIFNTDAAIEANNSVVHALFVVFFVIFAALTALNIYSAFTDNDKVNQVLIFKSKGGKTEATVGVIGKLSKKAVTMAGGVKVGKPHLLVDDNFEVTMRIAIKLTDEKVEAVVPVIRESLEIAFAEELGLKFKAIDFKVTSMKSKKAKAEKAEDSPAKFYNEEPVLATTEDIVPFEVSSAYDKFAEEKASEIKAEEIIAEEPIAQEVAEEADTDK
ncbi:MAG: hypothetical protein FWD49_00930 [Firmicutes bacterium]|nr:hypothetical protein [Bacillota bacterium]